MKTVTISKNRLPWNHFPDSPSFTYRYVKMQKK